MESNADLFKNGGTQSRIVSSKGERKRSPTNGRITLGNAREYKILLFQRNWSTAVVMVWSYANPFHVRLAEITSKDVLK